MKIMVRLELENVHEQGFSTMQQLAIGCFDRVLKKKRKQRRMKVMFTDDFTAEQSQDVDINAESSPPVEPELVLASDSGVDSDNLNPSKRKKTINFKTRTSPKGLFNLIRNLSEEQKEAVKTIGFGSLLSLGISKCSFYLCRHVLNSFDVLKRSIVLPNGDEILIDEDVVHSVLNIPKGEIEVVESIGKDSGDLVYQEFLLNWRTRWGANEKKRRPESNEMSRRIIENRSANNDFKIDFVVYVVSTFLWSLQHSRARFKILKSLMDVDNIKNLNWCKFTVTGLMDSVKRWQQNNQSFFDGPLTFLLLCYLDRVVVEGVPQPRRTFPIISCWDDNDISLSERNIVESRGDCFGCGRARKRATGVENHPEIPAPDVEEVNANLGEPQGEMMDSGSPTHNEKIFKSKVDQVFNHFEQSLLYLLGEFEKNDIDPKPIFEARTKIFAESDVYKRFFHVKGHSVNMEDQTPLTEVNEEVGCVNNPDPSSAICVYIPPGSEPNEWERCENIEHQPKWKITKLPNVLKSPPVRSVVSTKIGNVLPEEQMIADFALFGTNNKEYLFVGSSAILTRGEMRSMTEMTEVDSVVVDVFTRVLNLHFQRQSDGKIRRICFSTSSYMMIPFGFKMFTDTLVLEMEQLGVSKEDIDNADLIFLPVIDNQHYYAVCINMIAKNVEILDNRPLPKGIHFKDNYVGVKEHVEFFVEFLKKIKSPLAEKVPTFKHGIVVTRWQDLSNVTCCCGVYCMRHLETYTGDAKKWKCDITIENASEALEKLRIKYIYIILSSELNQKRDELLGQINHS